MSPSNPRPVARDAGSEKRRNLAAVRRALVAGDFSGKEELAAAVFDEMIDGLRQELEALAKTELKGKEMLAAIAKVILNHLDRNRDFPDFGVGRLPVFGAGAREKLTQKHLENHASVLLLLVRSSSDEGRSFGASKFAAAAFLGLCRSAAESRILSGIEGPFERDSERVVSFFLDGSGIVL